MSSRTSRLTLSPGSRKGATRAQPMETVQQTDPSIPEGFQLLANYNTSLEFRNTETQDTDNHTVTLRLLTKNDIEEPEKIEKVMVEIIVNTELFSLSQCVLDEQGFQEMIDKYQLNIDFSSLPGELKNMFDALKSPKSDYLICYYIEPDGNGKLEFNESLDLRSVEIFSLNFTTPDQEVIAQRAQLRYSELKDKLKIAKARNDKFRQMIKRESPVVEKKMYAELQQRSQASSP